MGYRSRIGWIGVDLDGTLAQYERGDIDKYGVAYVGPPIQKMLARVKQWVADGKRVKIMTARAGIPAELDGSERRRREEEQLLVRPAIERWCLEHVGQVLEITCVKDFGMIELWDDRAVQIISNTGERADGKQ
jgi:hypothetical protein